MELPTLLILGFLAGSLIKLTDDIADRKLFHTLFAIPLGITYGLIMGVLMLEDADASLLFGGIVLGCLITGKINSTGHYFGLGAILIVILLYGAKLSPVVFPIATLAALDELKEIIKFPALNAAFDYRLFLKLGILVLVILNIIGINALLILIAFDSAYILTEKIDSRFS
ncbi:MAG: hypothetical protein ABOK23_05020 [Candidatus Methanoperedens sp.]|nr:hypothetical protein [Candidatus Methanoperedens sp.]MCZ7395053.1 hypothetical protein [Candidatus Methanoperedens sp.]